jgi:hypothetical protein
MTTIVTTSVAALASVNILGPIPILIGAVLFAALLIAKDVTANSTTESSKRLNQAVTIAFIPMCVLFGLVFIAKIIEVLS